MRQPYSSLFAGFEAHWLFGDHLAGDVPDWDGLLPDGEPDSRLSSSERMLLWIGLAIWNGNRTATIADLACLDYRTRLQVLAALAACR